MAAAIAFLVTPVVSPPITGYDAARFPVYIPRPYIQPAGYAFSIWGLMYAWLTVHAVFGLTRRADDLAWDVTRLPLAGSGLWRCGDLNPGVVIVANSADARTVAYVAATGIVVMALARR